MTNLVNIGILEINYIPLISFNPSVEVFKMERWTQYSEEDIKFMRREYRKQQYILKFITTASLLLAFFGILWV